MASHTRLCAAVQGPFAIKSLSSKDRSQIISFVSCADCASCTKWLGVVKLQLHSSKWRKLASRGAGRATAAGGGVLPLVLLLWLPFILLLPLPLPLLPHPLLGALLVVACKTAMPPLLPLLLIWKLL